jgi:hypothetical protein
MQLLEGVDRLHSNRPKGSSNGGSRSEEEGRVGERELGNSGNYEGNITCEKSEEVRQDGN